MRLFNFFKKKKKISLLSEELESLATASDEIFTSTSKDLLKNFDEYITIAETESESLSIELDDNLEQQSRIEYVLKNLSKPNSWQERHYLLKLDRLKLHGNNLRARIEIYSQNIKVYLNLISKVQDIKAMRLNGLDENKIEHIWLEFKKSVEDYRSKLNTEEAGYNSEVLTTNALEERLRDLKKEIFKKEKEPVAETQAPNIATIRENIDTQVQNLQDPDKKLICE